jgi:hypothetical protein
MAQLHVIVHLSDSQGTSFTITGIPYEEVLKEFQQASAEHRLMQVSMERPGFVHRINPQQVAYINQLEY